MAFLSNDVLSGLGMGYSIGAIALVVPICFGLRHYLRFLDHLQIFYLFYLGLASTSTIFSTHLDESWVLFPRNFYIFCQSGDLICMVGFPLSFTSCLIVFLLLMRIIVAIQTCRKSEIRFEPVYTFFKGFFRWTYMPLTFYSLYFLILSIQGKKNDLIPSIVILAVCVLFPIAQLIGYKCIQTDEVYIWRKWLQFFSYLRLILFAVLVAFSLTMNSKVPFYFAYAIYVLYIIIYGWKNKFVFPIMGRVVFVLGELCAICISFFFLFQKSLLTDYHLDYFFISLILIMDLCYIIGEIVYYVKYGVPKETTGKVMSESSEQLREPEEQKDESYNELEENISKSKAVRRRK